jgi:hypothetical protein
MNLRQSHWAVYFVFWLFAVVVGGALIGAIGFPLLGPLFGSTHTPLEHAMAGARHMGFIAMIWAPAIALVLCVIRAYRNRHPQ